MSAIIEQAIRSLYNADARQGRGPPNAQEYAVLDSAGKPLDVVVNDLQKLIGAATAAPTSIAHVAAECRTLALHLSALGDAAGNVPRTVANAVGQSLRELLQLQDFTCFKFHEKSFHGLAQATRLALLRKYPAYATEGFLALVAEPPSIYVSAAHVPHDKLALTLLLGLPDSAIVSVPCDHGAETMDVDALRKIIEEDLQRGRVPVLVVGQIGTPLCGAIDDFDAIAGLSSAHDLWLHLQGHALARLALPPGSPPPSAAIAAALAAAHSVTVTPDVWLGLLGAPSATYFRELSQIEAQRTAEVSRVDGSGTGILALPLWVVMQHLGSKAIVEQVQFAFQRANHLSDALALLGSIKTLAHREAYCPVVLFTFVPDEANDLEFNFSAKLLPAVNRKLWTYLAKGAGARLGGSVERIGGTYFYRFSPLEHGHGLNTAIEDIDVFVAQISQYLDAIINTMQVRPAFVAAAAAHPQLNVMAPPDFVGLGIVRYVPSYLVGQAGSDVSAEIKDLNTRLCATLVTASETEGSPLFGLGLDFQLAAAAGNTACVCVGVPSGSFVTAETAAVIVKCIASLATHLPDNPTLVAKVTDALRDGIRKAQTDLEEQSEQRIFDEGILRQIPVVGSLLNWFSPQAQLPGPEGLRFSLPSGKLEHTKAGASPANASPPADQVDSTSGRS